MRTVPLSGEQSSSKTFRVSTIWPLNTICGVTHKSTSRQNETLLISSKQTASCITSSYDLTITATYFAAKSQGHNHRRDESQAQMTTVLGSKWNEKPRERHASNLVGLAPRYGRFTSKQLPRRRLTDNTA